jgi:ligand-binding sensor domain-containing protein
VKKVAPPKPVEPPKPEDLLVNLENQVFNLMSFVPVGGSEATTLLASTWDGLFMTEDEKKGWKPLKIVDASGTVLTSGSIEVMTSNPLVPGSIWIATEDGLFVSRDNGATFAPLRLDGERHQVKAIAFDPRDAAMIYVGSLKGFFRSTDGGRNWEKRGGGMPLAVSISAITISPVDPDEVFLSDTNFGGFYHSRDRGRTWEAFDTSALPTRRFRSLGADPFDRNRIYAGPLSTGGVYVMTRQGEGKSK